MKTTFTYLSFQKLSRAFFFLVLFLIVKLGFSQTPSVSYNLLKAPCDNDGIIVIETSGFTPPIIFDISEYLNLHLIDTLNSTSDTVFNYDGGYLYLGVQSISGNPFLEGHNYAGHRPFNFRVFSTPAICPALGSLKVLASGGVSPYRVEWFAAGNDANVIATGDSVGLPGGSYDLKITDAKGCIVSSVFDPYSGGGTSPYIDSVSVQYISPIHFIASATTANCTNGTVSISNVSGGHAPYGYQWSNGANTSSISGLITGNYAFTITDGQGCIADSVVNVPQSVTINVHATSTKATCSQNDGSIVAFGSDGVPPYTYAWNTGQQTQSISNLPPGDYSVLVTDSRGCMGKGGNYVNDYTPINITYSAIPSSCTAATGSASLHIIGGKPPYNVKWHTYPEQSDTTAINLAPGTYSFEVTDSNGCLQTGDAYVPPVSIITAGISKADALCTQSNGEANVAVLSGSPPFKYHWNTGATEAIISNLPAGQYSCTITDNMGCFVNKSTNIDAGSPIGLLFASVQASCLYASDGNITATPFGGTAPYTYNWYNGQTTASAIGLKQGYYTLNVSDAGGCVQSNSAYVGYDAGNDNCYCTIAGTVYVDSNKNCVLDAGEAGIQNVMIHLSGFGYTYSDQNGHYSFVVPSGSYTLTEDVEYYYPLASCQSNAIAVNVTASSGCVSTYNFANVINPIHDVSIYTTSYNSPPIPGYKYHQLLVIKNNGTITEDSILSTYGNDGRLSSADFSPALFTLQTPDFYISKPDSFSLEPGASRVIEVNYNVPTNIPLGTVVNFNDTVAYHSSVANWLTDYSPWNNVNAYQNTVVGSFDPNYKEVSPVGNGPKGLISTTDSILTYTIHFQNTGSYPAQKVVVVDTLDTHLDLTTLRPGYSNYTYSTAISEKGVLTFTFNGINLPAVSYDNSGTGFVSYSIHQKTGNAPGTQIHRPASIYFDYNKPVKTNAALNTLEGAEGVKEPANKVFDLTVYPNPASGGKVNLLINSGTFSSTSTVDIYNLLGQLIQSNTISLSAGKNIISLDAGKLSSGLYFVRVNQGKNTAVGKLTIIK